MSTDTPSAPVNRLGLTRDVYKGLASTLCAGCGHNSITNNLIKALYDYGVDPYKLAKMSGIGCSSKTPAYFVERAHGFNGVHGRMPSLATGAKLANRELMVLGISGDGDTASIGLGQYCHLIRRNVDCTYIIEDNGCYGLTKGQFSATADRGSVLKKGQVNEFETIDVCGLAVELGATFVARSFSGDGKQLIPLLQAAFSHRGIAVLDVISPCVTFNDHEGSTKSYAYVKEHHAMLHTPDFIVGTQEITVDYEPGTVQEIVFDDGNRVLLRKLDVDYDPADRISALRVMHEARDRGELVTGLLYVDTSARDLCTRERLPAKPLAKLDEDELRLSREQWSELMSSLR
ncbi:MAG TPA: 2-oxoacid:ferredoxin oxidoreductase subunit beta [Candidatus Baltobacteraceae bacterium]|jgi:2-oxoglutarate ferredoxin oxidoreductase subunit beta|nr:2-oxoacid:ferredoxin oxidoreductase subunit beta [Candidatus Baltobacteraceae bacterium]